MPPFTRGVPSLGASNMNALKNLYDYCNSHGVKHIFAFPRDRTTYEDYMQHAGFVDLLGDESFLRRIDNAIARKKELFERDACGEDRAFVKD